MYDLADFPLIHFDALAGLSTGELNASLGALLTLVPNPKASRGPGYQ